MVCNCEQLCRYHKVCRYELKVYLRSFFRSPHRVEKKEEIFCECTDVLCFQCFESEGNPGPTRWLPYRASLVGPVGSEGRPSGNSRLSVEHFHDNITGVIGQEVRSRARIVKGKVLIIDKGKYILRS